MTQVKVACRVAGGLKVRRFAQGDEGPHAIDAGLTLNGPDGAASGVGNTDAKHSAPGYTMVDEDWIRGWLAENKQTIFVQENFVEIVDEDAEAEEAEREAKRLATEQADRDAIEAKRIEDEKAAADQKAKEEAEAKAKAEAEAKEKDDAEAKAKEEADAKAKLEAEEKKALEDKAEADRLAAEKGTEENKTSAT